MDGHRNLILPVVGGMAFIVVSLGFELLFSPEPNVLGAIVGGVAFGLAWFLGARFLQKRNSDAGDA